MSETVVLEPMPSLRTSEERSGLLGRVTLFEQLLYTNDCIPMGGVAADESELLPTTALEELSEVTSLLDYDVLMGNTRDPRTSQDHVDP